MAGEVFMAPLLGSSLAYCGIKGDISVTYRDTHKFCGRVISDIYLTFWFESEFFDLWCMPRFVLWVKPIYYRNEKWNCYLWKKLFSKAVYSNLSCIYGPMAAWQHDGVWISLAILMAQFLKLGHQDSQSYFLRTTVTLLPYNNWKLKMCSGMSINLQSILSKSVCYFCNCLRYNLFNRGQWQYRWTDIAVLTQTN